MKLMMLVKKYNKKPWLTTASLGIFIFLGAVFLLGSGDVALAQSKSADQLAWNGQQAEFGEQTGLSNTSPVVVIVKIIQIFLGFLGLIAVVLIIYAGFIWMTSAGDADKVKKAKDILKSALIGLIIILSSVGIVTFILNMLVNGTTGGGGNGSGGGPGRVPSGTGAIGNCAIVDYYPSANQKDVPRNSVVMVTFREALKFDTVVDGNSMLKTENVMLFNKCNDDCQVNTGAGCEACLVPAKATTTDNKTMIIMPDDYLGTPTEKMDYYMVLNNNILNSSGKGIFSNCTPDSAYWSFEVSTMLDLDPPQVLEKSRGGVFPWPDDQKDATSTSPAVKAHGRIIVNDVNIKTLTKSTIMSIDKNPSNAPWGNLNISSSNINEFCVADKMKISVNSDLSATLQVEGVNAGIGVMSADKKGLSFEYCELKTVLENEKNFLTECGSGGCVWDLDINSYQEPDYLSVGGLQYVFVKTGTATNEIAVGGGVLSKSSIATAIANKTYPDVDMVVATDVVTVTANKAGRSGNAIKISASNSNAFTVEPMSGGTDLNNSVNVQGSKDEPRNAIIKINFDDQMLPINVSGEATINSSILVQCVDAANCSDANFFFDCNGGKCVKGEFKISNQYKTVEFQSNNECGMNSCGEKIFCLPGNTRLRVGLNAATLAGCDNCAAKNPYSECVNSHCYDNTLSKNYPLSSIAFDGLMDKARNSLDGNRDTKAIGPNAFYNENTAAGLGDNFEWLFFINDKIDLTPPRIFNAEPIGSNVSAIDPAQVTFDKIMMSSSLIPGYIMIPDLADNAKEIKHKTFNVWAKSGFPVGFWVTSVDQYDAMQIGKTIADINHSYFDEYNNYRAQSGSGIKDIYQNCYKPSAGPGCDATIGNPSCCNGVMTNLLNSDGNCSN